MAICRCISATGDHAPHGNSIIVTVTIDEGSVFTVGKVDVGGDLKFPKSI